MFLTFYFKFGKKKKKTPQCTSKWQANLHCLHQETLRVLNYIHCLTSIKTQTINNQHAVATAGNHLQISEFVT